MQREGPNRLDYLTPRRLPEKRLGGWGNFWLGMAFGSLIVTFIFIKAHAGDPCSMIMIAAMGYVLTLPAGAIFYTRVNAEKQRVARNAQRLFFPLATLLFFPAAHLLSCKAMAIYNHDPVYVFRVNIFSTAVPWIVLGAISTALTWRSRKLGTSSAHWLIAGFVWPITVFSNLQGMEYLQWSWNSNDFANVPIELVLCELAAAGFVVPLIVATTFDLEIINRNEAD